MESVQQQTRGLHSGRRKEKGNLGRGDDVSPSNVMSSDRPRLYGPCLCSPTGQDNGRGTGMSCIRPWAKIAAHGPRAVGQL